MINEGEKYFFTLDLESMKLIVVHIFARTVDVSQTLGAVLSTTTEARVILSFLYCQSRNNLKDKISMKERLSCCAPVQSVKFLDHPYDA